MAEWRLIEGKLIDTNAMLPIHLHPILVDGKIVAADFHPCDCGNSACDLSATISLRGEQEESKLE